VTYYKGKCYAWDVVNEAFNDNGTYRPDIFYNTIGPEYIPIAFETAAAADPSVKLYYNDYNIESPGAKATSALNLVKSLKARGIKIDGVGLEAHFIVGETPSLAMQTANLECFTALGVEVAYTELDIRHLSLPPSTSALAQQATDYYNTVSACLATTGGGKCVGVTLWDYTDKYSWIPATFPGEGDACPWDANLVKKPTVYGAIVRALGGKVSPTTAVASKTTATGGGSTTTASGGGTTQHWGQCGG
jgi:endo-1,4-beta-xylanase